MRAAAFGSADEAAIHDFLGIGFGPANLALAVAMEELEPAERPRGLFLEARPEHAWHPDMLLPDSQLQITVIKDLVTVENPRSRFTFLNYLREKGRLYDFLNLRNLFPTRLEFNDYLAWAAGLLAESVRYGCRVRRIRRSEAGGGLLRLEVEDAAGRSRELRCRHLVLAAGGRATAPEGIELAPGGRAFHSHRFLGRIAEYSDPAAPYRFVVVGSGQSAGEIFEYLIDRFPNADVTATTRRFAYKPVDESDFTNRIFFPEWVDYYYRLPEAKRKLMFEELKDVNYAVIDQPLIHRIYQKLYNQKVEGRERARLRPYLELRSLEEGPGSVRATFRDLMQEADVELEADGLVLATGYEWPKEHPLLAELAGEFRRDGEGSYRVRRDYSIDALPGFEPRIYLQGYCERTHGIGETVLSLLPVRAKEILDSLRAALGRPRPAAPAKAAT